MGIFLFHNLYNGKLSFVAYVWDNKLLRKYIRSISSKILYHFKIKYRNSQ